MQNTGPIACPAHPCIGNTDHITHPLLDQLGRDGQHPPFRHTRPANRPCITEHHHVICGHIQIFIIDRSFHLGIAVKNKCRPCMFMQMRLGSGRFHHRAIRGKVAAQNCQRSLMIDRVGKRADNIIIIDFCIFDTFAQTLAIYRHHRKIQLVFYLL